MLEDDDALAFLDTRPLFPGHCLLVPKQHFETIVELPPALTGPLFDKARLLAAALPLALEAKGTFIAINNRVSQSVAHLHIHVVPRRFKDGLKGFFWPRQRYADDGEATAVQEQIKGAVDQLTRG